MSAAGGVNEDEITEEQTSEDEVEVDGLRFKVREKNCERNGDGEDAGEEDATEPVVEVVARFEVATV